jgi:hypothetical protein
MKSLSKDEKKIIEKLVSNSMYCAFDIGCSECPLREYTVTCTEADIEIAGKKALADDRKRRLSLL